MWVTAGLNNSGIRLYYSYNGINWFGVSGLFGTTGGGATAIEWGGDKWVVVGDNTANTDNIYYSYNGIDWTPVYGPYNNGLCRDVRWNGDIWVSVGGNNFTNIQAYYSYNGIDWVAISSVYPTMQGQTLTWTGSKWIMVGNSQFDSDCYYSYDGINWILTNLNIMYTGRMVSTYPDSIKLTKNDLLSFSTITPLITKSNQSISINLNIQV